VSNVGEQDVDVFGLVAEYVKCLVGGTGLQNFKSIVGQNIHDHCA
jgi:hypothetical protein